MKIFQISRELFVCCATWIWSYDQIWSTIWSLKIGYMNDKIIGLTVVSSPAVRMCVLSGEKRATWTAPLCPFNCRKSVLPSNSNTCINFISLPQERIFSLILYWLLRKLAGASAFQKKNLINEGVWVEGRGGGGGRVVVDKVFHIVIKKIWGIFQGVGVLVIYC